MKNPIHSKQGFSLVEILVVIAVIGIIAAIAIPAMSGIFGQAETAKAKHNAHGVASLYGCVRAAGQTVTTVTPAATVAALSGAGLTVPPGSPLAGTTFKISIDSHEIANTAAKLAYNMVTDSYSVIP